MRLRGVFEGAGAPPEAVPLRLRRALRWWPSSRWPAAWAKPAWWQPWAGRFRLAGERVLLVDTAAYGLLPFFFGARDQRPGLLRTFSPPGTSGDAPIQMVTIDPEGLGPDRANQEALSREIGNVFARREPRDCGSGDGLRRNHAARAADGAAGAGAAGAGHEFGGQRQLHRQLLPAQWQRPAISRRCPIYVLNQFDPSLPLHLDIREVLREQLGDRLLPFVLRRAPAVSEALAEGMTVMDYAPNSTVAEDFGSLAGWVKSAIRIREQQLSRSALE